MKRFKPLVLSFILSLTVFLIPWGFCFYEKEEAVKIESNIIIPKERSLLVMVKEDEPLFFILLKFNLNSCRISLLPPSLLVPDTDGYTHLRNVYLNGGLKYASKSLRRELHLDTLNYSSLSINELTELLSGFGSCDFTLSKDIFTNDGLCIYKKGRCLLNSDFAGLILSDDIRMDEEERLNILSELLPSLLNERKDLREYEKEEIFNALANAKESDLSIEDFLNLKKYKIFSQGFNFS